MPTIKLLPHPKPHVFNRRSRKVVHFILLVNLLVNFISLVEGSNMHFYPTQNGQTYVDVPPVIPVEPEVAKEDGAVGGPVLCNVLLIGVCIDFVFTTQT